MSGFQRTVTIVLIIGAAWMGWLTFEVATQPDRNEMAQLVRDAVANSLKEGIDFERQVESALIALAQQRNRQRSAEQERQASEVNPPDSSDHLYGNPDAPVTLIEFSDFECPYCTQFHAIAKQLVDASGGQVNWVYRHFPLESHRPNAFLKAEAAECVAETAGNEAFWRYTVALYARGPAGPNSVSIDDLSNLASMQQVDSGKIKECLESGRHKEEVKKDFASGRAAGVQGTPGNILYHNASGKTLPVHGAQPLTQMQQAVGSLISRAK